MDTEMIEETLPTLDEPGDVPGYENWLRVGGIKLFADGTPTGGTAWNSVPDNLGRYGTMERVAGNTNEEKVAELRDILTAIHEAGYQMGIHACGDMTNQTIIEIYADLLAEENNPLDLRHFLVHADFVNPGFEDVMAQAGISVSANPSILSLIGDQMAVLFNATRAGEQWPLDRLWDAGVNVTNGSDGPVTPIDWRLGVQGSVLREGISGTVYGAHNKVSVEKAIMAYTINSAKLLKEEDIKGFIKAGKLADFVILGEDIFKINPSTIIDIPIVMTIVDGEVVYALGRE
ncbi:MAG: amidohydrolase [Bacillota bacterium]